VHLGKLVTLVEDDRHLVVHALVPMGGITQRIPSSINADAFPGFNISDMGLGSQCVCWAMKKVPRKFCWHWRVGLSAELGAHLEGVCEALEGLAGGARLVRVKEE
jgi:hypothetical protein